MTTSKARPASLPLLWLWFALAGGLLEVGILAVRKYVLDGWINVGLQVVWMAPLSYLVLLLPFVAALALASRRWPERVTPRSRAGLLAFLTIYSVLNVFVGQLHWASLLLLALGVASLVTRRISRQPIAFDRVVRRTAPAMVLVTLALTVALNGWLWSAHRRALASLPAAPDAPNVLFIILDTVRAKSLSLYGYERRTSPNLERIARQGVRFDRALVTAPWSLPSHAGMFTGLYPQEMSGMDWAIELDQTPPTLAQVLSERGYETSAFMANSRYPQHEGGLSRGFARYEDYLVSPGIAWTSAGLTRALLRLNAPLGRTLRLDWVPGRVASAEVNADILGWLDGRGSSRPFFAFVNYIDAHAPYVPPEPFATRFAREPRRGFRERALGKLGVGEQPVATGDSHQRWIARERDAYDASVAYVDSQLGRLIAELERRGVMKNTLLVIAADHGEQFEEHGTWGHGVGLEMTAIHVPLIVAAPRRVPAGAEVAAPVSLRDLPATIVDLLELPARDEFPGRSLARFWEGGGPVADAGNEPVLSQLYKTSDTTPDAWKSESMSIVEGRLHYIRRADGQERLYDHESDPMETRDLSGDPAHQVDVARLRASLAQLVPGWPARGGGIQPIAAARP